MGETHPSNMRLTIPLLCLAAVAYSAPLGNSEMTEMFSAFKSEFNKVYETETELLQRYEMFTKNVNIINNHNENEAASAGYTMAINQFTDWTTQEFSAYLTYNGTAKKHYSTGVFSGTCGTSLDHGVLVVGYGTDGSSEYWKVKNSWGTTWGDAGYIRMTKSCASTGRQLLGGKTKAGECGILSQPSYPVV